MPFPPLCSGEAEVVLVPADAWHRRQPPGDTFTLAAQELTNTRTRLRQCFQCCRAAHQDTEPSPTRVRHSDVRQQFWQVFPKWGVGGSRLRCGPACRCTARLRHRVPDTHKLALRCRKKASSFSHVSYSQMRETLCFPVAEEAESRAGATGRLPCRTGFASINFAGVRVGTLSSVSLLGGWSLLLRIVSSTGSSTQRCPVSSQSNAGMPRLVV